MLKEPQSINFPLATGTSYDDLDLDSDTRFCSTVDIHKEPQQETESRIKNRDEDARVNRNIKIGLIILFSFVGLGLIGFCVYIILNPNSQPESISQAWTFLSLIIGGVIGFFTGKNMK